MRLFRRLHSSRSLRRRLTTSNLENRLNEQNDGIGIRLSAGYRLIEVRAGQPVPPEVDAFVYGPRQPFADIDLYDLDQFLLTGKPVVLLLNNFDVMVNQWDDQPPYNLTSKIQSTNTNLDSFQRTTGHNNKDLDGNGKGLYERINTISIEMSNIGPLPLAAKYSYPLYPTFEYFSETDP